MNLRRNPPTLEQVNDAWAKVCAQNTRAVDVDPSLRTYPHARPFYQGTIDEHLRQQEERERGSKLYRAPSAAHRRAVQLTRAWLEFGRWP